MMQEDLSFTQRIKSKVSKSSDTYFHVTQQLIFISKQIWNKKNSNKLFGYILNVIERNILNHHKHHLGKI